MGYFNLRQVSILAPEKMKNEKKLRLKPSLYYYTGMTIVLS